MTSDKLPILIERTGPRSICVWLGTELVADSLGFDEALWTVATIFCGKPTPWLKPLAALIQQERASEIEYPPPPEALSPQRLAEMFGLKESPDGTQKAPAL